MIFGNIWGTEKRTRSVTPGDKAYLIRVSGGKCEYCDDDITGKHLTANIHHIVEFASRGSDRYHNLIVLCPNCHSLVHGVGISKEKLRAKIEYRLPKKTSVGNTTTSAVITKKTVAKKAVVKRAPAKKTTPKWITAEKATIRKTIAKKTAAKKATAKKPHLRRLLPNRGHSKEEKKGV